MNKLLYKGAFAVPFLALAVTATAVTVLPPQLKPKPNLAGIWVGDTTTCCAPSRTTAILIEPDGTFWGGYYWRGTHPYMIGKVNVHSGVGEKIDFWGSYPGTADAGNGMSGPQPAPKTFLMPYTDTTLNFLYNGVPSVYPPFSYGRYHNMYDWPLTRQVEFDKPMTVMPRHYRSADWYGNNTAFTMVVVDGKITGTDGECHFTGTLETTPHGYKKITYTYPSNCYRTSYSEATLPGTTEVGVLYPMKVLGVIPALQNPAGTNYGPTAGFMLNAIGKGNKGDVQAQFLVEGLPATGGTQGGIYSQSTASSASVILIENDGRLWGSEYLYGTYQIEGTYTPQTYNCTLCGNGQAIGIGKLGTSIYNYLNITGPYEPQKSVQFNYDRTDYTTQISTSGPVVGATLENRHTYQSNWLTELEIPNGVFEDIHRGTRLNVKTDGSFSGDFGPNCSGKGTFGKTGKNYRRIDIVVQGAACMDDNQLLIPSGTRLVGVMPGTYLQHGGINYGAWVAIFRSEANVVTAAASGPKIVAVPPAFAVTKTFLKCPAPAGTGYKCN